MDNRDFESFRSEMFRLYQQGNYAGALELTLREYQRFPDQAHDTAFWRICLFAITDHSAEALQVLDTALTAGLWFSAFQLRQDSDLASLQGMLAFERLLAISKERFEQAQASTRPALLTLQPEHSTESLPLLIALHGNNGNAANTARHWSSLVSQGWLVALPQSSQLWSMNGFVWDDYERAENEIKAHVAALCQQYPIDRIVVAGFSRGGETAIRLVLSGAVEARGFVVVGPAGSFMAQPDQWPPLIERAQARGIRGYILLGERDPFMDGGKAFSRFLSAGGIPNELDVRPGVGHEFPPDFAISLEHALKFILSQEVKRS